MLDVVHVIKIGGSCPPSGKNEKEILLFIWWSFN
jgi:hypothetical protein